MSNIKDINIKDVNYFLKLHRLPTGNEPYLAIWNFLISNNDTNILVPESIADWIIAYNNRDITYNEVLKLGIIDRTRIIRILSYLGNSPMDNLPNELIIEILLKTDCKDIPKMCQLSTKINNICNNEFIPYFKDKLTLSTGLVLKSYNFKQLLYLCRQQKYRQYNKIATGSSYTLIISKGRVYTCGSNEDDGIGLSDINQTNDLVEINGLSNIIEVAAGSWHSLALDNNGNVYSFGDNYNGQLGLGDKKNRILPTLITNLPKIINIYASVNISALLTEDGRVYTFGEHIGIRNSPAVLVPTLNTNLSNIVQISIGNGYLLALDNNGKVYGYGDGQITYDPKFYIFENPRDAQYPENIMYIAADNQDSFAIDINGKLYFHGVLYQRSKTQNVSHITLDFKVSKVYNSGVTVTGGSEINILALSDDGDLYDIHSIPDQMYRKLFINKLNISNIIYKEEYVHLL